MWISGVDEHGNKTSINRNNVLFVYESSENGYATFVMMRGAVTLKCLYSEVKENIFDKKEE